jgi:hypothetical protein
MLGVTFLMTRAKVGLLVSRVMELFESAFAPAAPAETTKAIKHTIGKTVAFIEKLRKWRTPLLLLKLS